jgi:Zn-dependent M28 family amino/carboxypeptidase
VEAALSGTASGDPEGAGPPHPAAPRLRAHVDMLAGTIGERNLWHYEALEGAAQYISGQLTASGYTARRQTFELAKLPMSNVEGVLEGTSRASEIVVVGAHYDSVSGCPGANDNGTGVAAVLELAQRLARTPRARTIRFVAFVNEEPPFFQTEHMGSAVYANAAKARGDRIAGMLSLETMGYYSDEPGSQRYPAPMGALYPDVGNFIGFVANVGSARLLLQARRAFKQRTSFPVQSAAAPAGIPGVGWSDHWSFWQAGYPAMMVTDTAPFRYPWYHTPDDTPDKIDYDSLAHVVDGLEAVIQVVAS